MAKNLADRGGCELKIIDRHSKERGKDLDAEIIVVLTQSGSPVSNILIPAIAVSKRLKKIVYLSTLLIYSDSAEKQIEDAVPEPKTEYERNKYQEELILQETAEKIGCKLCIARLSNVYGDIKNRGVINKIIQSLIQENKFIIYSDKHKQKKDYIFIEDAVNLLEFLIFYEQQKSKEIFNICTGSGHSIKALMDIAEKIVGRKINFEEGTSVLEKQINIGDNQKILALSHYKLKYNLTRGLKKTYTNYLKAYL